MALRIIVGFVLLPILFVLLFFAPAVALPIGIAIISALAIQEILTTTHFITQRHIVVYAMVFSALIPFWVFYTNYDISRMLAILGLFLYVVLLFISALTSKSNLQFEKISGVFFASIVIPYFFSSLIGIAGMVNGRFYVLLPFVVAFGSDIFALFVGRAFGKHKLAPDISPNKTLEGSLGGFIGALFCMAAYMLTLQTWFGFTVNWMLMLFYAVIGSFLAQIGDLSFSFVKRQFHIKDFGTIIPGHGGILDRFDSILFVSPVVEVLLIMIPVMWRA